MRKFLIPAAIIASTLAAAAPAAAQWQPPQGNAYGYENRGQMRRLEVRITQLRREIARLDRRNVVSEREARRLDMQVRELDARFRQYAVNGISMRERYDLEQRIARLEQNIRYQATDGNRRGNDNRYGDRYDSNGYDRDRDGRDDRYEDDRGRYPG